MSYGAILTRCQVKIMFIRQMRVTGAVDPTRPLLRHFPKTSLRRSLSAQQQAG